jgi:glycosyltransferase involved in cell wall biosynthesis
LRTAVLIPAFNAAATIGETLASLLEQGRSLTKVSAVYVADDGSTDDTVRVARSAWRSQTPLVVYDHDANVGERANVNRAVTRFGHAVDWMCLLHADDVAKPVWLATLLATIESSECHVASVCCSWDNLHCDGRVATGEDDPARQIEHIPGAPFSVRQTLLDGCWWHASGCAIRISAFEQIGPFDPSLPQLGDWDWLLRCLAARWTVAYIPRTLILYRLSPNGVGSLSLQADRDISEGLRLIRKYREFLTRDDMLRLHATRAVFALRRAARGLARRRWQRVARALATTGQVIASAATEVGLTSRSAAAADHTHRRFQ